MSEEEIIKMAEHAGFMFTVHGSPVGFTRSMLKDFAKMVADHEREACIKIVMQGTGEPIQRKTLDILQQERTRIVLAIKEQE